MMITAAGVRRALYTKRKQLQQAKLEEEREQPAPEPLSLPADVLVACLSNLTEVGAAGNQTAQCSRDGGARAETTVPASASSAVIVNSGCL